MIYRFLILFSSFLLANSVLAEEDIIIEDREIAIQLMRDLTVRTMSLTEDDQWREAYLAVSQQDETVNAENLEVLQNPADSLFLMQINEDTGNAEFLTDRSEYGFNDSTRFDGDVKTDRFNAPATNEFIEIANPVFSYGLRIGSLTDYSQRISFDPSAPISYLNRARIEEIRSPNITVNNLNAETINGGIIFMPGNLNDFVVQRVENFFSNSGWTLGSNIEESQNKNLGVLTLGLKDDVNFSDVSIADFLNANSIVIESGDSNNPGTLLISENLNSTTLNADELVMNDEGDSAEITTINSSQASFNDLTVNQRISGFSQQAILSVNTSSLSVSSEFNIDNNLTASNLSVANQMTIESIVDAEQANITDYDYQGDNFETISNDGGNFPLGIEGVARFTEPNALVFDSINLGNSTAGNLLNINQVGSNNFSEQSGNLSISGDAAVVNDFYIDGLIDLDGSEIRPDSIISENEIAFENLSGSQLNISTSANDTEIDSNTGLEVQAGSRQIFQNTLDSTIGIVFKDSNNQKLLSIDTFNEKVVVGGDANDFSVSDYEDEDIKFFVNGSFALTQEQVAALEGRVQARGISNTGDLSLLRSVTDPAEYDNAPYPSFRFYIGADESSKKALTLSQNSNESNPFAIFGNLNDSSNPNNYDLIVGEGDSSFLGYDDGSNDRPALASFDGNISVQTNSNFLADLVIGSDRNDQLLINARIENGILFDIPSDDGVGVIFQDNSFQFNGGMSLENPLVVNDIGFTNLISTPSSLEANYLKTENLNADSIDINGLIIAPGGLMQTTSLVVVGDSTFDNISLSQSASVIVSQNISANQLDSFGLNITSNATISGNVIASSINSISNIDSLIVGNPTTKAQSIFQQSLYIENVADAPLVAGTFVNIGSPTSATATLTDLYVIGETEFQGRVVFVNDEQEGFGSDLDTYSLRAGNLEVTRFATIASLNTSLNSTILGSVVVSNSLTAARIEADGTLSAREITVDSLTNQSTILGNLNVANQLIQTNADGILSVYSQDINNISTETVFNQSNPNAQTTFEGTVFFNEDLELKGARLKTFQSNSGGYVEMGSGSSDLFLVNQDATLAGAALNGIAIAENSSLTVYGRFFTNSLEVANNLTNVGNLILQNQLRIGGATSGKLFISSDATIESGLDVEGDIRGINLSLSGSDLNLTNNLSIGSDLVVSAMGSIANGLNLSNSNTKVEIFSQNSTSDGMSISDNTTVGGALLVGQESVFSGNVRFASGFRAEGIQAPDMIVTEVATMNFLTVTQGLTVDSNANFQEGLVTTNSSNIYISQGLNSSDQNSLLGGLFVSEGSTLNTLNSVSVNDAITVTSLISENQLDGDVIEVTSLSNLGNLNIESNTTQTTQFSQNSGTVDTNVAGSLIADQLIISNWATFNSSLEVSSGTVFIAPNRISPNNVLTAQSINIAGDLIAGGSTVNTDRSATTRFNGAERAYFGASFGTDGLIVDNLLVSDFSTIAQALNVSENLVVLGENSSVVLNSGVFIGNDALINNNLNAINSPTTIGGDLVTDSSGVTFAENLWILDTLDVAGSIFGDVNSINLAIEGTGQTTIGSVVISSNATFDNADSVMTVKGLVSGFDLYVSEATTIRENLIVSETAQNTTAENLFIGSEGQGSIFSIVQNGAAGGSLEVGANSTFMTNVAFNDGFNATSFEGPRIIVQNQLTANQLVIANQLTEATLLTVSEGSLITQFNGALTVAKGLTVDGGLTVTGLTTTNNGLMVSGDTVLNNLTLINPSTLDITGGTLTVSDDITANNSLLEISSLTSIGGNLNVSANQPSNFLSNSGGIDVTIDGILSAGGLASTNNTTFNNNLYTNSGSVSSLNLTNTNDLPTPLTVQGAINMLSNSDYQLAVQATFDTPFSAGLLIIDGISVDELVVSELMTSNRVFLTTTDQSTSATLLTVSEGSLITQFNGALTVAKGLTVDGGLTVTGLTTTNNGLMVSGDTVLNNLTLINPSTLDITGGTLTVSDDITANNSLLEISSLTSIGGNLNVSANQPSNFLSNSGGIDVTIDGILSAGGLASTNNTTFNNNLYTNSGSVSSLNLTNTNDLPTPLTVQGAINMLSNSDYQLAVQATFDTPFSAGLLIIDGISVDELVVSELMTSNRVFLTTTDQSTSATLLTVSEGSLITQFNGALTVAKGLTVDGGLTVTGLTTTNNGLMVSGDTVLNNLTLINPSTLDITGGILTVSDDITANNSLLEISSLTSIGGNLNVSANQPSNFLSNSGGIDVTIDGILSAGGLASTNNTTFNNNLYTNSGSVSSLNLTNSGQSVTIGTNLAPATLQVQGESSLYSDIDADYELLLEPIDLNDLSKGWQILRLDEVITLIVNQTATMNRLTIGDDGLIADSDTSFLNGIDINGNLAVNNNGDLIVAGETSFAGSTFNVIGDVNFAARVNVDEVTALENIQVSGQSNFNNLAIENLLSTDDIIVNRTLQSIENISVDSALFTQSSDLEVAGVSTLNKVNFLGNATFNTLFSDQISSSSINVVDSLTISENLKVEKRLTGVSGSNLISGRLEITGDDPLIIDELRTYNGSEDSRPSYIRRIPLGASTITVDLNIISGGIIFEKDYEQNYEQNLFFSKGLEFYDHYGNLGISNTGNSIPIDKSLVVSKVIFESDIRFEQTDNDYREDTGFTKYRFDGEMESGSSMYSGTKIPLASGTANQSETTLKLDHLYAGGTDSARLAQFLPNLTDRVLGEDSNSRASSKDHNIHAGIVNFTGDRIDLKYISRLGNVIYRDLPKISIMRVDGGITLNPLDYSKNFRYDTYENYGYKRVDLPSGNSRQYGLDFDFSSTTDRTTYYAVNFFYDFSNTVIPHSFIENNTPKYPNYANQKQINGNWKVTQVPANYSKAAGIYGFRANKLAPKPDSDITIYLGRKPTRFVPNTFDQLFESLSASDEENIALVPYYILTIDDQKNALLESNPRERLDEFCASGGFSHTRYCSEEHQIFRDTLDKSPAPDLSFSGLIPSMSSLLNLAKLESGGVLHLDIFTAGSPPDSDNVVVTDGNDTQQVTFTVSGLMRANRFETFSDSRFKTNITNLVNLNSAEQSEAFLSRLHQIDGVQYQFNQLFQSRFGGDDSLQTGFIAQQLQQVVPELVSEGEDGYLSVNYSQFTAYLLEGIKVLDNKINRITDNLVVDQNGVFINQPITIGTAMQVDPNGKVVIDRLETNNDLYSDDNFAIRSKNSLAKLVSLSKEKQADDEVQGYLSARDVYLADYGGWMDDMNQKLEVITGIPKENECLSEQSNGKMLFSRDMNLIYVCDDNKGWQSLSMASDLN